MAEAEKKKLQAWHAGLLSLGGLWAAASWNPGYLIFLSFLPYLALRWEGGDHPKITRMRVRKYAAIMAVSIGLLLLGSVALSQNLGFFEWALTWIFISLVLVVDARIVYTEFKRA